MLKVFLIRHGETEWNVEGRFRGRCDISLSRRGLEQAQRTAEALSNLRPAALLSSPLKRCLQTAQPLADRFGLTIEPSEGLNDVNFGEWSGLRRDEVKRRWSSEFARWRNGDLSLRFPGGESLNDAKERIASLIRSLEKRFGEDDVVVCVTHQVPLKLMVCWLLGEAAFWRVHFEPASITVLRRTSRLWQVVTLGSAFHLEGLL